MNEFPRFYPILDTAALAVLGMDPVQAAEAMLKGGARILQFRHKGHYSRAVFAEAEAVAGLCRRAGAQYVINDRADVALLLDAGVHVGQDDLPVEEVRRLVGPERVVGYSTHNPEQLAAAAGLAADYVALGPVFPTHSKQNPDPVVGLDEFGRLRALCSKPLVAIGGITRARAGEVLAAGADAIAVIGDLLPEIEERTEEWMRVTGGR
jgi:thiamine-phosphate pyrophosphorylase